MMMNFGGHIGSSVSALVDGQLAEADAERAWSHVLTCPPCRRLVEREGWVKRQLATMGGNDLPQGLLGSLYQLDPAQEAWAAVDELERKGRGRRRAGLALAGAGSVSAAVFGIATLGGAGLGISGAPAGAPAASMTGSTPSSAPTTAVIAPRVASHGRLPLTQGSQRSVVLLDRR
ncbi:MAG TPA: hypothetical protein VFQ19_01875 [Nocardioidaceae bacterium]|nr:hypothetical protein [Nocardioidaceae bacterium]